MSSDTEQVGGITQEGVDDLCDRLSHLMGGQFGGLRVQFRKDTAGKRTVKLTVSVSGSVNDIDVTDKNFKYAANRLSAAVYNLFTPWDVTSDDGDRSS